MSNLPDLYQEAIIDHYRNPRNFHKPEKANRHAEGLNPLCGDRLSVYVEIEDDAIKDIGFTGTGCAISIASASMMTESLKLKTIEAATAIAEDFHQLVGKSGETQLSLETIGKLSVFSGVRGYPARVKCATLAWEAFQSAVTSRQ